MFCTHCGFENPQNSHFCGACGERLLRHEPPAPHGGGDEPESRITEPNPNEEKSVSENDIIRLYPPSEPQASRNLPSDQVLGELPSVECPVCGLWSPGTAELCDCGHNFTTARSSTAPTLASGTKGQRLAAYLADLVVAGFIVMLVGAVIGFLATDDLSDGTWQLLGYAAFAAYMTLANALYHTTIGKYVMGLEVRSVNPTLIYPTFSQILLRETIGRLASSLFFGVGYWGSMRVPENRAWSDRLANTVVTKRETHRFLRQGFAGFLALALILYVAVIAWAAQFSARGQRYEDIVTRLQALTTTVNESREAADELWARDWDGAPELRAQMVQILAQLATYEGGIDQMITLYRTVQREELGPAEEADQITVLLEVSDLRKRQISILRETARLLQQSDDDGTFSDEQLVRIEMLDSDVIALEAQASQLLADELGIE